MKCQAALVLVLAYFTAAYECPAHTTGIKVFEANLNTGQSYIHPGSRITWLKSLKPLTSLPRGSCSQRGVLKITFPKPVDKQQTCRFKFDLHHSDLSSGDGYNFNIGDSISNNGFGKDAGHTSNYAEVHNFRDTFYLYSNLQQLQNENQASTNDLLVDKVPYAVRGHVSVTIGNEFVKFENPDSYINKCYAGPHLFTLNGQTPLHGDVDYDIYFSMNRVIYPFEAYVKPPSRTGVGLCKVVITAMDCDIPLALPPGIPQ